MKSTKKPICALVVGHSRISRGAVGSTGMTEFDFNSALAGHITRYLTHACVDVRIVLRDTYKDLPDKINALQPDFVISLHCNAYDKQASGSEVLYYYQSESGKRLAAMLQAQLFAALGLPDRGIKPKRSEDRGGYLLRYTDAPCVIAEPFFIDNDDDHTRAWDRYDSLIYAYAETIRRYAEKYC